MHSLAHAALPCSYSKTGRPGRVIDAFCQPGCRRLGVDVANGDIIEASNEYLLASRERDEGIKPQGYPYAGLHGARRFARLGALLARRIDCVRVDAKHFAAARGLSIQVKPRGPFLVPFQGVLRGVVTEIPPIIHRPRLRVKQGVQGGLHAVMVSLRAHRCVGLGGITNRFHYCHYACLFTQCELLLAPLSSTA